MGQQLNAYQKPSSLPIVNSHAIAALKKEPKELRSGGRSRPLEVAIRIPGLYGHNPLQNHLLAALPADDYERLLPHLELASMPAGSVICEVGKPMSYVYFPTSSIVSMLHDTKEGSSTETAVIGNEGLVGVTLCMGGGSMVTRTVVKSAGYAFRMKAHILKEEFDRGGAMQNYLLRYTQALLTQMSQAAVCNRHHSVGQQLCRWLLLSLDRLPSNELSMTQELIANMLGVRRESVTEAAGKLQEDKIIHYSRGRITVLNRPALESRVCECYATVKHEYDRLLATKTCSHK